MTRRVTHQPGYVLHRRPWSESSLVVEVFTQNYGRVGVLAKGARRLKSPFRGLLEPFQELQLGWSGKGDLPVLTGAEFKTRLPPLQGTLLFSGFYLNELLMRLLVRRDPNGEIYRTYGDTQTLLRDHSQRTESVLRQFEMELLRHLGYGLLLESDAATYSDIQPDLMYDYVIDHGPVAHTNTRTKSQWTREGTSWTGYEEQLHDGAEQGSGTVRAAQVSERSMPYVRSNGGSSVVISGRTLLAMHDGDFTDRIVLAESKRLLREQMKQILDGKSLQTRYLLHGVRQRLSQRGKP